MKVEMKDIHPNHMDWVWITCGSQEKTRDDVNRKGKNIWKVFKKKKEQLKFIIVSLISHVLD
jgi:fatty-acid desaturase